MNIFYDLVVDCHINAPLESLGDLCGSPSKSTLDLAMYQHWPMGHQ